MSFRFPVVPLWIVSSLLALGLIAGSTAFANPSASKTAAGQAAEKKGEKAREADSRPDADKTDATGGDEKSGDEKSGDEKPGDKDSGDKAGKPKAAKPTFIRIRRDDKRRPVALETPIVRYVAAAGDGKLVVDLVGAVHVGEKDYYTDLNKRFKDYDVVLYELVAPEGTRVPRNGARRSRHPVSMMQQTLKSMLGLEFQLEQVDYSPKNFVHADMSPDEFAKSMKDRGESFMQMYFRLMGQAMAMQAKNPESQGGNIQLFFAALRRDKTALKQLMAEQMETMDGGISALDGPEGSTIITQRNKKAFEVLDQEIKAGRKRIAVFYGAGHLPDMESRLIADFGMRRKSIEWVPAWSLRAKKRDR